MDSSRYELLCGHLRVLLELTPSRGEVYLNSLMEEQPQLADELRRLIESDRRAELEHFLEIEQQYQATQITPLNADQGSAPKEERFAGKIDSYQIGDQLGEGGMGTIFRAYQPEADRHVALKILRAGQFNSAEQIQRFRKEAKAAAAMQHEHIVPVYDVGEAEGVPYFTMAIIEGRNLKQQLDHQSMESRESAELLIRLAQAVAYAHERGVIHRDLKPSNVLIDHDGKVWLTDFGIAKRLNESEGVTQPGQILGTANYISPEQIEQPELVGPRTDIHGLGCILYHCLTGQASFPGDDIIKIFTNVKTRLPTPPQELNPLVDRDLAAICMRCLQKAPADRYGSAESLITDLKRFLSGEPLQGTDSSWKQSIARVLKYRELSGDLPSAGAARWSLAASVFLHATIFLIVWFQWNHYWLWATLVVGTLWQSLISYRYHWSQYWHLQMVERQSGIIQLAVNLGFVSLFLIHGPLTFSQPVRDVLDIYPPLTIIVGVATFAHAGIHAGRWLISGFVCFPVSVLIARYPDLGPLLLIAVSALILSIADSELRHVAKKMHVQS